MGLPITGGSYYTPMFRIGQPDRRFRSGRRVRVTQSKGAAVVRLALRELLRSVGARGKKGDRGPGNGLFRTLDGAR